MYEKGKMRPGETILRNKKGDKENDDGGGEFNYCQHFVNVTMYHQCNNNMIIKIKNNNFKASTLLLQLCKNTLK
jgi:hypothetical protein